MPEAGDEDWNAACDEAAASCVRVGEDASIAAEDKRGYTYADGWEDACAQCAEVIRDLKVKANDEDKPT